MNEIYVIVWTGRDCQSDVWDTYPMLDEGYFTDKQKAQSYADYLNKEQYGDIDPDCDDQEQYGIVAVCPSTKGAIDEQKSTN